MSLLKAFWKDDQGSVLSAELVLLGTLGVVGATVGVNMAASEVNKELHDFSLAIRSLDQSYAVKGFASKSAWTAGSSYQQEEIAVSSEKPAPVDSKSETNESKTDTPEEEKPAQRSESNTP